VRLELSALPVCAMRILQEQRTAWTGTHVVLIIHDGRTRRGGQRFSVFFECHFSGTLDAPGVAGGDPGWAPTDSGRAEALVLSG
jgi:hypothetical protein